MVIVNPAARHAVPVQTIRVAAALALPGWDVEVVINGQLGLDSLARRRPDVVLVDLMMPVMGGSEMIAAMRGDPELAAIPAIPAARRSGEPAVPRR